MTKYDSQTRSLTIRSALAYRKVGNVKLAFADRFDVRQRDQTKCLVPHPGGVYSSGCLFQFVRSVLLKLVTRIAIRP